MNVTTAASTTIGVVSLVVEGGGIVFTDSMKITTLTGVTPGAAR